MAYWTLELHDEDLGVGGLEDGVTYKVNAWATYNVNLTTGEIEALYVEEIEIWEGETKLDAAQTTDLYDRVVEMADAIGNEPFRINLEEVETEERLGRY